MAELAELIGERRRRRLEAGRVAVSGITALAARLLWAAFEHRRDTACPARAEADTDVRAIARRLLRLEDRFVPRETEESRWIRGSLARPASAQQPGNRIMNSRRYRPRITGIPGL
jgi:hypothetical protein